MVVKKKKKEKIDFDASLMGGYLPGGRPPVTTAPVSAPAKLKYAPVFINWRFQYIPRYGEGDPGPEPTSPGALDVPVRFTGASPGFWKAWAYYGLGGIADPKNFGEATIYSRVLGIPYVAGWIIAGTVGFLVTGLAFTFVDPMHKWEGGLDETALYKRIVPAERPGVNWNRLMAVPGLSTEDQARREMGLPPSKTGR